MLNSPHTLYRISQLHQNQMLEEAEHKRRTTTCRRTQGGPQSMRWNESVIPLVLRALAARRGVPNLQIASMGSSTAR